MAQKCTKLHKRHKKNYWKKTTHGTRTSPWIVRVMQPDTALIDQVVVAVQAGVPPVCGQVRGVGDGVHEAAVHIAVAGHGAWHRNGGRAAGSPGGVPGAVPNPGQRTCRGKP